MSKLGINVAVCVSDVEGKEKRVGRQESGGRLGFNGFFGKDGMASWEGAHLVRGEWEGAARHAVGQRPRQRWRWLRWPSLFGSAV